MKDIKDIIVVSLTLMIVVLAIHLLSNEFNYQRVLTVEWIGILTFYSVFLTLINAYYFKFINYRFEWKNKGLQRILVSAGGSIVLTILGYMFCGYVIAVIIYQKQTSIEFLKDQKFEDYLMPLFITVIASLFFHTMHFYKALQEKKVAEQKIIAGTASAKFDALKNQLDPHFLFNSLNVLTSLIDENPRMAQKFTTSLSKVYRYVLEQKDKELVSIEEELKFAKTYMTLLKLRFEDSIIFEMPTQLSNPNAKIVPLSLQILLENTIKHNVVMPEKPLKISIYEKDGFLFVENNLQPKQIVKQRSGVGLVNVKQRYALLTKRAFSVYKTEDAFIAKLPLLTKQITTIDMDIVTPTASNDEIKYERIRKKVQKIKEFQYNLISYSVVIPGLAILNYVTTGFSIPWFIFPLFGWGLGLLFHGMDAYEYHPFMGKNWEEKKIRKYMNQEKRSRHE
ncbi:2TM domain-containing protein [Aquimarina hainanensis]|uniref:2TM domain-containing protein n=1 Tax=Aquimarina hainanensis TaxID=1578017 RepID=A0ABW5NAB3_9FLAO|nr:2TM domain-containing protein [Aquimarina sp. TRL1]QKX07114.1 Pr2TM family membrane protein [Aquimarina sp. TRL1]